MDDKQAERDRKYARSLVDSVNGGLAIMKEFCEKGESIAMVQFGAESARVMHRAVIAEMRARGLAPDIERWKREAKAMLSPEHYRIWEAQVLPLRLQAWQEPEPIEGVDLQEESGKSDARDPEVGP